MKVIKTIRVELQNRKLSEKIYAMQGDAGSRYIKVILLESGNAFEIEDGIAARIYAEKPDGTKIYNDCEISENSILAPLTSQALAVSGNATCVIDLRKGDQILTSFEFILVIRKKPVDSAAIESTNEFTAFDNAMKAVEDVGVLKTPRAIDGVLFDGTAAVNHYAACSTAAATAAKVATITNFSLVTGAKIAVKFTYGCTATSPTLNINSTGAKAIYYKNAALASGVITANNIYEFIYDGTYWRLVGDVTQADISALNDDLSQINTDLTKTDITSQLSINSNFSQCRICKTGNTFSFYLPYADVALTSGTEYTVVTGLPESLRPKAGTGKNVYIPEISATGFAYLLFNTDGSIKLTPKVAVPAAGRMRIYEVVV